MMSLLVRMPEKPCSTTRTREVVGPESTGPGLSYLYLGFVHLLQGERRGFDFGPLDTLAVVMSGSVEAAWEDADGQMKQEIVAGRHDVFDGPAWAICARPYTTLFLKGLSARAELALIRTELIDDDEMECSARSLETAVTVISPRSVQVGAAGRGNPARLVCEVASVERRAEREGAEARRLIVGETLIAAGDGPDVALCQDDDIADGEDWADPACERVLHFRFRPEQGAAIQRVCSPSRDYDHTYRVGHGDTVAVPFGLRPNAPTCDSDLYILWAWVGAGVASTQPGGWSG